MAIRDRFNSRSFKIAPRIVATMLGGALISGLSLQVAAQNAESFYKGKTVNLAIGFSAGGGYDLYARHLARYIGKYIPGNPTVIPQNMAGAGSLRVANFLYGVAPKDGTTFGAFSRSVGIQPLLDKSMKYDATKFTWLGSIARDVSTCVTWYKSPIKTWQDLLDKPSSFGGEGPSGEPDLFALLYRNIFDAKIKLVTGYPGTQEITLAMERGEVDGLCGLSWSTIRTRHMDWVRDGKVNILVQASFAKSPDLSSVPLAMDLTNDPRKKQILKVFTATQELARPFAAPPGLPDDRKAALTTAFDQTMKDPEFLAEAKKMDLDVDPVGGQKLEELLVDIYATPKDVLEQAAAAVTR